MGERQHVFLEGAHFESVAFTGELESSERGAALLESLRRVQCRGALVSKQVMETIAGTKTPQGVAALVSRPYLGLDDLFSNSPDLLVVADELQDPGNLGTIIRTAEAAGANTVDPFNERAIRASMGSALRLPIVTGASRADIVTRCRDHQIKMIASRSKPGPPQGVIEDAARAERIKLCIEVDMTVPVALIVGREATGIPESAQEDADEFVHIPMAQDVESLNVATATAILLYEADRQRGFRFSKV